MTYSLLYCNLLVFSRLRYSYSILFPSHEISLAADPIAGPTPTNNTHPLPCNKRNLATLHFNQYITQSPSCSNHTSELSSHHYHITTPYTFTKPLIMPSIRSVVAGLCLTTCALLSTTSAAAIPPKVECSKSPALPLTGGKSFFQSQYKSLRLYILTFHPQLPSNCLPQPLN